mmetsp:Transcript_110214/g.235341  ORF Transcript_110214/g.235341 Transcript_110214/m.235341 type:complete len:238 (-) Transcript_110214:37-750(-)
MKCGNLAPQPSSRSEAAATRVCTLRHHKTLDAEQITAQETLHPRAKPGLNLESKASVISPARPRKSLAQQASSKRNTWRPKSQARRSRRLSQLKSHKVRNQPKKCEAHKKMLMPMQSSSAIIKTTTMSIPQHTPHALAQRGRAPDRKLSASPSRISASIFSRVTWRDASRRDCPPSTCDAAADRVERPETLSAAWLSKTVCRSPASNCLAGRLHKLKNMCLRPRSSTRGPHFWGARA